MYLDLIYHEYLDAAVTAGVQREALFEFDLFHVWHVMYLVTITVAVNVTVDVTVIVTAGAAGGSGRGSSAG